MRAAVVGHVEWIEFLRVSKMPTAGEIVHASDWWEAPGGGGSVAAVQLLKLAGTCSFFTALGDDDIGRRAHRELLGLGLDVHAVFHPRPTRRGVTHVDATGERTITVVGERLAPSATDPLPWGQLEDVDAIYFTAGDAGALKLARAARALVATSRIMLLLMEAGVELDALVGSALDPSEAYLSGQLQPPPRLVVRTEGGRGGTFETEGEREHFAAPEVPGPIVDHYGAGDSFAAGLAFALAKRLSSQEAVGFAARCGAAALTGRGPFGGQLTA
jgi:ribokinase